MKQDLFELAQSVLKVSRNTLAVHLRFMNMAISRLRWLSIPEVVLQKPELSLVLADTRLATEGTAILYDPMALCRLYAEDKNNGARTYLHLLLHGIFWHFDVGPNMLRPLWDLACDMATEGVINELNLPMVMNAKAVQQQYVLDNLALKVNRLLTAEKIYVYLRNNQPSDTELAQLKDLFSPDVHNIWYARKARLSIASVGASVNQQRTNSAGHNESAQNKSKNLQLGGSSGNSAQAEQSAESAHQQAMLETLSKDWRRIAERMQTDLETFNRYRGDTAGSMMQNLRSVNREKYDYTAFLSRFAVLGEAMCINDDEFDYVFYTYGMRLFPEKRLPLIEPLEYRDVKRIREFVIAIDTSGSVAGEQVQAFLQKTCNILLSTDNFFKRVNIHIIQCDAKIQEDIKITSHEEFECYLQTMKIKGLGGTDFRPVFMRVDEMIHNKEFINLKGLIYFTDGYGVFPERMPTYKTAFVFVEEGYEIPEVPVWAMKLVLTKEDMEEMTGREP